MLLGHHQHRPSTLRCLRVSTQGREQSVGAQDALLMSSSGDSHEFGSLFSFPGQLSLLTGGTGLPAQPLRLEVHHVFGFQQHFELPCPRVPGTKPPVWPCRTSLHFIRAARGGAGSVLPGCPQCAADSASSSLSSPRS